MLFKNYPDRIVIECNHDDLRRICAVRSPYVRADWYKGMRLEPDKDVILTYSNDKHTEMRSKMATGVSLSCRNNITVVVRLTMNDSMLAKEAKILKKI